MEKKTMWAVTRDLKVKEKVVITDGISVVACSDPVGEGNKREHFYGPFDVRRFLDTEQEAIAYRDDEIQACREAFPKVKAFIKKMDGMYPDGDVFKFDRAEYLGDHAKSSGSSYYTNYISEEQYAEKLETYIKSGMLSIDGLLIPRSEVVRVKWFRHDNGDEYEADDWLAELTLRDGSTAKTGSEEDVRLVWAVLGKCSGAYYIDDDFDYDKEEEE